MRNGLSCCCCCDGHGGGDADANLASIDLEVTVFHPSPCDASDLVDRVCVCDLEVGGGSPRRTSRTKRSCCCFCPIARDCEAERHRWMLQLEVREELLVSSWLTTFNILMNDLYYEVSLSDKLTSKLQS
jgi:hypothetical protein